MLKCLVKLLSLTLTCLGGQIDPPPPLWFFEKCIFYRGVEPWFFVTFNIILKHNFPENFIEFP